MRTVYKYQIMPGTYSEVEIPGFVQWAAVAMQGSCPTAWALCCDPDKADVNFALCFCCTGHPVPDGAEFVGTAFDGPYVWHVFAFEIEAKELAA